MDISLIMVSSMVLTILTWAFLIAILIILFFRKKKERGIEETLYKIGDAITEIQVSVASKLGEFEKAFKDYSPKNMHERLSKLEQAFHDFDGNFDIKMENKIFKTMDSVRKAPKVDVGKKVLAQLETFDSKLKEQDKKMYDFMLKEIFDDIELLNKDDKRELGKQMRRLNSIIKMIKARGYWEKNYKTQISAFLRKMSNKWDKVDDELKSLFHMSYKKIR